ncbi:MAG: hypothetical protein K5984_00480 [Bacteroidales bacterium]|jgi:dihydroneopterin aldolase|nr:hypothetical protein [Bacteroidales bacterium]
MRKIRLILARIGIVAALLCTLMILRSCGIYSFTGSSIDYTSVKTITINYFEYKALKVNPSLSNDLTEAVKDQFRKQTRLEQVDMDGDLEIEGEITGYDVRATAVTADEVASQNRLTVTVKIKFTNRKDSSQDLEKSFSQYADYDSTNSLDAVESTLCEEIIEKLCDDIFNATVAQW